VTHDISEVPVTPRRRDASFYIVLFFAVAPVWSVVPLSWLYVVYSLSHVRFLHYGLSGQMLFATAFLEVLFSIYYYALTRQVSWTSPSIPTNMLELQDAFRRVLQSGLASLPEDGGDEESLVSELPGSPAEVVEKLAVDDPRAIDYRNRLRTWFRTVPWSHIRLEQVRAWLYWMAFNSVLPSRSEISKSHHDFINETVALLETRIGCSVPPGSNPNVTPLLLTIDPMNVRTRPFVWYLFVKMANVCLRAWYQRNHGITYGRFKDLEYLIYVPPDYSRASGPDPIVLLHGLGLGIFQYQQAVSHFLSELPHVPFLIPIQPQISQDIFHPRYLKPMLRHEKVICLHGLLEKLGWVYTSEKGENFGITLVSHSNGTFSHAWMLKSFPDSIKRSCLMDPVTFCSWEGDVCYNFVYKPCVTGFELIIRYFVGTELGVANLLQRHFDWLNNTLWFEEIPNACDPRRTLYVMGGKDNIVDSERIRRYLLSHGVRKGLIFDPNGWHGESLITGGEGMRKVIEWIKDAPDSTASISS